MRWELLVSPTATGWGRLTRQLVRILRHRTLWHDLGEHFKQYRELKTKLHESTTIFQETLTACQDLLNGENDALDLHAVLLDEARGGVEKPTNSAR